MFYAAPVVGNSSEFPRGSLVAGPVVESAPDFRPLEASAKSGAAPLDATRSEVLQGLAHLVSRFQYAMLKRLQPLKLLSLIVNFKARKG